MNRETAAEDGLGDVEAALRRRAARKILESIAYINSNADSIGYGRLNKELLELYHQARRLDIYVDVPVLRIHGGTEYREEAKQMAAEVERQLLAMGKANIAGSLVRIAERLIVAGWESGMKREFKFDPNSTENEGRWRLYDPSKVDKKSYFRRKSSTSGVSYVMGKANGGPADGKTVIQAVRFDKEKFTEADAAKWWKENHGRGDLVFSDEDKEKKAMDKTYIAKRLVRAAKMLVGATGTQASRSRSAKSYTGWYKTSGGVLGTIVAWCAAGGNDDIEAMSDLHNLYLPGAKNKLLGILRSAGVDVSDAGTEIQKVASYSNRIYGLVLLPLGSSVTEEQMVQAGLPQGKP